MHPVFQRRFVRQFLRLLALLIFSFHLQSQLALAQSDKNEIESVVRDYLSKNPELVEKIVRDYLRANPEVVQGALTELIKRHMPQNNRPSAADQAANIKLHAEKLFNSPRQVVLGNRDGDVTLVEFFDYNCGFCRRSVADKLELLTSDPKLKVVLKELPVLGPGSTEAAQVAVAVRMQDPGGEKYLAFHRGLMAGGPANKLSALSAARGAGLDMARIELDLASPEIKASLDETRMLANALGINGTPSFVIGDTVTVGAAGVARLSEKIAAARR